MGDEREKLRASAELELTIDRYTDGTATALEVVEAAERWRHSSVSPSEDVASVLDALIDPDPCEWDHNHSCQAHGHFYIPQGGKCPNQAAADLLAALRVDQMGEN